MNKLETIEGKVKEILIRNPKTRGEDMLLYLEYSLAYGKAGIADLPFGKVMRSWKYYGLPYFESIRRARQKIQAETPWLKPKVDTRKGRKVQEKQYRRYAKDE